MSYREKTPEIKVTTSREVLLHGDKFDRRWGYRGVTEIHQDMRRAHITITQSGGVVQPSIAKATNLHELGHVSVAQDVADSGGEAFETLLGYDRFQHEVEAWVRGYTVVVGGEGDAWMSPTVGYFTLDCLNTYRRALRVTDEEWNKGRAVVIDLFPPKYQDDLWAYKPMEPEPGEDGGTCVTVVDAGDWQHGEEGEEGEKGSPGEDKERDPKPEFRFDFDWDDQVVVDALISGQPLHAVQEQYGLGEPTPLAWALAGGDF